MTGLGEIGAVAVQAERAAAPVSLPVAASGAHQFSFGALLAQGVEHVETKIRNADELVRAFAVDDSVPIHEVTVALEEARLAVEMALQVRTRLVESYREIMNMQL